MNLDFTPGPTQNPNRKHSTKDPAGARHRSGGCPHFIDTGINSRIKTASARNPPIRIRTHWIFTL
jgi:hypothetical protein